MTNSGSLREEFCAKTKQSVSFPAVTCSPFTKHRGLHAFHARQILPPRRQIVLCDRQLEMSILLEQAQTGAAFAALSHIVGH
ncbi:hypothetical protein [Massilia sp. S19_KUP03_FR1]|uniref:hypothetical protein n=1 Tax=Massilia sp. S19_KUP03_FR1 TaxID=3025503 RepID=UPI002FCD8041